MFLSKEYFREVSTPDHAAIPWPVRHITDPSELKALAHPVRFALIDLLAEGPLTATQCAQRLGQTPANCSYHLRQLAAYGHVVPAEGGRGRERYWKARDEGISFDDDGPGGSTAARAVGDAVDSYRFASWERYKSRRATESEAWRRAAGSMDMAMWMTPEELEEFTRGLYALVAPFAVRDADAHARPSAARMVRFFAYSYPGERAPQEEL